MTDGLTTDPKDPRLGQTRPGGQRETYLVLSDEECAKGFVRPLRISYRHKACGGITRMAQRIAETYARNPKFYDGTFCGMCSKHLPLAEFVWIEKDGSEGPVVGT